MQEINGKAIAQKIIDKLKSQPAPKKILAAVLISENPASVSFLTQKEKVAKELGVDFRIYRFSAEIKNDDLRKEVSKIALLKKVSGVIVQLPLPEHLNRHYILNVIPREKDVDVLGERALGAFYTGRNPVLPPAVGVVEEILKYTKFNIRTSDVPNIDDNVRTSEIQKLKVAVVGLGFLIGKPIAHWLMGKISELYLLDKGSDLSILKQADLIISGVGKPGLFSAENVKEGGIIIDFGYFINNEGKIHGDFNPIIHNSKFMIHYTPTPGGTGPILVAKIFENFYKLNQKN